MLTKTNILFLYLLKPFDFMFVVTYILNNKKTQRTQSFLQSNLLYGKIQEKTIIRNCLEKTFFFVYLNPYTIINQLFLFFLAMTTWLRKCI